MAKDNTPTPPADSPKASKRTSSLNLPKNTKLRARLINGKHQMFTLEECLLEYNWKRLAKSTQENITNGRTATDIRAAM